MTLVNFENIRFKYDYTSVASGSIPQCTFNDLDEVKGQSSEGQIHPNLTVT